MQGWWRRDRYFMRYMARELTAPFVALYALELLAGLVCLALGPAAYEAWVAAMRTPPALAVNALVVGALLYHTVSWFEIMPRTMPPVMLGGRRVGAAWITRAGMAAAAACMIALWLAASAAA
jgi:fumarate reductase subunit C